MAIPPEKQQEIAQEVAQTFYQRHIKALRSIWDGEGGGLPFAKAKPRERLNSYINGTLGGDVWLNSGALVSDLVLVIQPDYPKHKRAGELPELLCVRLWTQYQAAQASAQQPPMPGQPPSPPPMQQPPPLMWVYLSELPDEVFGWVAGDLRSLLNEYASKRQEQAA